MGPLSEPIFAIAIFTGPDGKKMPLRFEYEYRKTRLVYQYHSFSILDFTDEELEISDNPFAQVILVARISLLESIMPAQKLLERKVLIATKLFAKGFTTRKIRAIFVFLENSILFENPKMNRTFKERILVHDKNNIMGIDEYLKEMGKEEGLEQGLERGLERGRAEGEERRNRLFVENLLSDTDFSNEKIASLANVTVDFVNDIKAGRQTA